MNSKEYEEAWMFEWNEEVMYEGQVVHYRGPGGSVGFQLIRFKSGSLHKVFNHELSTYYKTNKDGKHVLERFDD